jgi:hypothetical protein
LDIDNVLNSSQFFSSANNPIQTDDLDSISDREAIKGLRSLASSDQSTSSSLTSSSSSSSLSLTDDSSENDLENSDSDFSPLSDPEHRKIEEFILNKEDDDIKDFT